MTSSSDFPFFINHPKDERFPSNAAVRALDVVVLPTGNNRSEAWSLPVYTIRQENVMWDALDVRELFPEGYFSVLLSRDPGTTESLPNNYRLYVDNLRTARPFNKSVHDTMSRLWVGNVVVTKYNKASVNNRRSFAHISRGEADLLVHVIGKYLDIIWKAIVGEKPFSSAV